MSKLKTDILYGLLAGLGIAMIYSIGPLLPGASSLLGLESDSLQLVADAIGTGLIVIAARKIFFKKGESSSSTHN